MAGLQMTLSFNNDQSSSSCTNRVIDHVSQVPLDPLRNKPPRSVTTVDAIRVRYVDEVLRMDGK